MAFWVVDWYLWLKAAHIMAVIAWMAGLFYLPRLFVYHVETVGSTGETHALFLTMERKLLRVIMNPAMIATWALGLILATMPGLVDFGTWWVWGKLAGIAGMTWFHMWLAARRRDFEQGENRYTGRQFRMMNEVPTALMVLIVLSVVVKF